MKTRLIAMTIVIITAVLLVISISIALASHERNSFRYKGSIIETGDYAFTVAQKCGAPIHKEITGVIGEHWVYDLGHGYYYLKFYNKKLVKIESIRK